MNPIDMIAQSLYWASEFMYEEIETEWTPDGVDVAVGGDKTHITWHGDEFIVRGRDHDAHTPGNGLTITLLDALRYIDTDHRADNHWGDGVTGMINEYGYPDVAHRIGPFTVYAQGPHAHASARRRVDGVAIHSGDTTTWVPDHPLWIASTLLECTHPGEVFTGRTVAERLYHAGVPTQYCRHVGDHTILNVDGNEYLIHPGPEGVTLTHKESTERFPNDGISQCVNTITDRISA